MEEYVPDYSLSALLTSDGNNLSDTFTPPKLLQLWLITNQIFR